MTPDELLPVLIQLERELHNDAARSNPARLSELLHPEFVEFGRSGQTYDFAQVINQLPKERSSVLIHSQDFKVRALAEGLALLTYRSAYLGTGGLLERHSLRSSLWKAAPAGWQMLFHQGTPTEPFAHNAS